MSGIFKNGVWHENADMVCNACGGVLYEPRGERGNMYCFQCARFVPHDEATEQDAYNSPRVMVARPAGGITLNEALEYLLDPDTQRALEFASQPDAEAYLMHLGYHSEELEHLYFVESADADQH